MSVSAFFTNVMFFFLFFHSLLFLPALNLSGDICNSDSTAVSLLGILKTVMSRSCSGNPFHSYRQSVAPQDFIHSVNINTVALDLDLGIHVFFSSAIHAGKKWFCFLFSWAVSDSFRVCVSSVCVMECKIMFYKSSPEGRNMFYNDAKKIFIYP